MKKSFNTIVEILNYDSALKLLILRYGISVDAKSIEENCPTYPVAFRTKRISKNTKIVDGCLIDAETKSMPWIPEEIFIQFSNIKSIVKVNYNKNSNFILSYRNNNLELASSELEIKLICELSPRPTWNHKQVNNFDADQYIQVMGKDRIAVLGFEGCSEWFHNTQCKFCDSCSSRANEKSIRPTLNDLNTKYDNNIPVWLDDFSKQYFEGLKEVYKLVLEDKNITPHHHLHIMSGNLPNLDMEWEYMLDLSRELSKIKPLSEVDSYLNILPPLNTQYLYDAKEIGFQKMIFNLEVYLESYFKSICPGKHAHIPYNIYLQQMEKAVEIFGIGKVRCSFVLGAQPINILCDGIEELASKGIVSDFTVFTPKKGTPWENKIGPDIIEVAKFCSFLKDVYVKYGFSGLYCSLASRSGIMNELLND